MITRRGLLAGILSAGFAPAAIGSGVLMPVRKILTPAVRIDPPLYKMEIGQWDGIRFITSPVVTEPRWAMRTRSVTRAELLGMMEGKP